MPFNEIFNRMFGLEKGRATCTRLERSHRQKTAYAAWVKAQLYLNWTASFFKSYHYQKSNLQGPLRVKLIQDTSVRGAIFFYDPNIGARNFTYLFDFMKDRVHNLGYTLHSCDKLVVRHERYTEEIEKQTLTPPASDLSGTSLCNQLYGNVLLDYIRVNNHPGYIRFVVNMYNDPYFSKPLPFEDLLEKVLQPDETPEK